MSTKGHAEPCGAAHREEGRDGSSQAQDHSDQQLDQHDGLDVDALVRENHLCVGHGDVIEALDMDVALGQPLQGTGCTA